MKHFGPMASIVEGNGNRHTAARHDGTANARDTAVVRYAIATASVYISRLRTSFLEKPDRPQGYLAYAGTYLGLVWTIFGLAQTAAELL